MFHVKLFFSGLIFIVHTLICGASPHPAETRCSSKNTLHPMFHVKHIVQENETRKVEAEEAPGFFGCAAFASE